MANQEEITKDNDYKAVTIVINQQQMPTISNSIKIGNIMFLSLTFGIVIGWCGIASASLVKNSRKEIQQLCSGNLLWDYLLSLIIINFSSYYAIIYIWFRNYLYNNQDYKYEKIIVRLTIFLQIGMAIWGTMILNSKCSRDNLTTLFIYSVVNVWVIFSILGVSMMFISILICACCLHKNCDVNLI